VKVFLIRVRPQLQVMPCTRFFIGSIGAFVATLGDGDVCGVDSNVVRTIVWQPTAEETQ
jgi:hypothetical protein